MSGIPHGIYDVYLNTTPDLLAQELFKKLFDFFELLENSYGYCTRIALQYGSGGTGTDFHDGANPFGTNAFFVFEFPSTSSRPFSYYVMFQYSQDATFGSSPGDPALVQGSSGSPGEGQVAFSVASALDSSGVSVSPWTGSTNNDGTDRKGVVAGTGPVWEAPVGGTLFAFPRSNSTGGSYATDRENMTLIAIWSSSVDSRFHMVGDQDGFYVFYDFDDDNNYVFASVQPYLATKDFEASVPLVVFRAGFNDPSTDSLVGDSAGTSSTNGGVVHPDNSQVVGFRFLHPRSYSAVDGTSGDDEIQNDTFGRLVLPESIWLDDPVTTSITGLAGQMPVEQLGIVRSDPEDITPSSGPPFSHITVGLSTVDNQKWVLPWGAPTAPNNSSTRDGTNF